jgi:hypothetical protein
MSLPARQVETNTALLQSKVADLEQRLAVLEQFIKPMPDGGVSISAPSGSLNLTANGGGGVAIAGNSISLDAWQGVTVVVRPGPVTFLSYGDVCFKAMASARIVMNKAPTIEA